MNATDEEWESEKHFRNMAEYAPLVVWTDDLNLQINYVNRRGLEYLGVPLEEILNKGWINFVHPDDRERWLETLSVHDQTGEMFSLEGRLLHHSGQYRWVEAFGSPRLDTKGRFSGFIGMVIDVHAHKEAEAYLRNRERMLQDLADSMPFLVWRARPDGVVDYYNARWYQYTGMKRRDTDEGEWLECIHPNQRESIRAAWRRSVATLQPYAVEHQLRDGKTGAYRWHLARALPVYDAKGNVTKWYGSSVDVEHEKKAAEEVKRLCRRLEAVNRVKDQFLAVLSHELRTPLSIISGYTDLLITENLSGNERKGALDALSRNTKMLERIVDDILDVSKIVSGKLSIHPSSVDICSVVTSVVESFSFTWRAKGLTVLTHCVGDLPPILADADRMRQVVWNLLSNAIKFTPSGGQITLRVEQEDGDVVISVTDTGQGIAPEFLPRIFERFSQEDSSAARNFGGLGLGLAIVRHIVELHGGHVAAASKGIGRGTTMSVRIPALLAGKKGMKRPGSAVIDLDESFE